MATRQSKIVDGNGDAIEVEILDREISAGGMTGVRQPWHAGVAAGLGPERLASILQAAAEGDNHAYLTLAEEMEERDAHYGSVLGTVKLALSGLEPNVEAFSDDADDVKVADAVRAIVAGPRFSNTVFDLADGLSKGYAVVEIMWDRSKTPWVPKDFKYRDPRFFRWDRETGEELRLLDEADPVNGIPLPPYKFIVFRPKLRSGLGVRSGLARLVAVAYMCKAWTWKDWMAFADVFGLPMRVGTYGPGAKEEDIDQLMRAVANLGSDAAAVIHESTKIIFEAAANTAGAADFFEKLATFWDKQVSKAVLGQTMTTDDGASLSQAEVHEGVHTLRLRAFAKALAIEVESSVVAPFVDLNYGHGRYPKVTYPVPDPEDLKLLLEALEKLVPMGLEVEQSVIRDKFRIPDPDKGKDVKLLRPPMQSAPAEIPVEPKSRAQAENRQQPTASNRVDQLGALLAPQADRVVAGWIGQVEALVDGASSLEEVRDGLLGLFPDMDGDRFGALMQQALTTAGVAGISDALDDANA